MTALIAIIISQSKAYYLRNWLLAFILFELLKLYAQVHVYRAVRENELYLIGVSLRVRLFSFAVDNCCFLWFLYGNVLYYTANEDTEMGFMFSAMFCAILIYGYTYMLKYTVEFVVVCCMVPIWSCLSPAVALPVPSVLSKVRSHDISCTDVDTDRVAAAWKPPRSGPDRRLLCNLSRPLRVRRPAHLSPVRSATPFSRPLHRVLAPSRRKVPDLQRPDSIGFN